MAQQYTVMSAHCQPSILYLNRRRMSDMKRYEEPRIEVIEIAISDVVTASTNELTHQQTGGNNGYNWSDWF